MLSGAKSCKAGKKATKVVLNGRNKKAYFLAEVIELLETLGIPVELDVEYNYDLYKKHYIVVANKKTTKKSRSMERGKK